MEKNQSCRFLRAAVFLTLGFFITFGPFYTQVLQRKKSKIFHSWDMFPGRALDFYALSYYMRTSAGDLPLSYHDFDNLRKKRGRLWKIDNVSELKQANQFVCKATEWKSDIRLEARLATRKGWKIVNKRENNICKA